MNGSVGRDYNRTVDPNSRVYTVQSDRPDEYSSLSRINGPGSRMSGSGSNGYNGRNEGSNGNGNGNGNNSQYKLQPDDYGYREYEGNAEDTIL